MSAAVHTAGRADAQRSRILEAARRCFAERGFHGASMASIAETAGISQGLIYRYFDGKSQIIRGIVDQQLALMAEELRQRRMTQQPLAQLLEERYFGCFEGQDRQLGLDPGLVMEISAEAARDPVIGEALRGLDRMLQEQIEDWMGRAVADGGAGVPAEQVPARALMLRFILDGMKMRQARDPDLDRDLLHRTLRDVLPCVVQGD